MRSTKDNEKDAHCSKATNRTSDSNIERGAGSSMSDMAGGAPAGHVIVIVLTALTPCTTDCGLCCLTTTNSVDHWKSLASMGP